jgi:hypothetical protein
MSHLMMFSVVKCDSSKQFALNGLNGWALDDLSSVVSVLVFFQPKQFLVDEALTHGVPRPNTQQSEDGRSAAEILREDGTIAILSKALAAPPASAAAASPTKLTEGDLSAAPTPDKLRPAETAAQKVPRR